MNMIKKILSAVIAVMLLLPTVQNVGAANITSPLLKGKTADTVFSVLDGRLSIKMPKGSVDEDVHYGGIMGTTADSSGETCISFSANGQEFAVYAQELFYYSSGDLLKDAGIFLKNSSGSGAAGFKLSDIRKASNIQYITITPNKIKAPDTDSLGLLKGALVRAADNTLVFLSVYADAGALTYEKDCVSMADSVIKSVQGGKRLLDASPRTVKMYGCSLNIEKDYVYTVDSGVDFDVYYFYKLVTIGKEQPYFGIYTGGHPAKSGSGLPSRTKQTDTIFGKKVTWDVYSSAKDTIDKDTFMETIVEHKEGYIHIFTEPKSKSDWAVIAKMLHTLKEVK